MEGELTPAATFASCSGPPATSAPARCGRVIEHPRLTLVGRPRALAGQGRARRRRALRARRRPACSPPATSTTSSPSAPTACSTCRRAATSTRSAGCSSRASNIVTTRGEFHHPASMDPAVRERVEAACAQGGTSIHSTGSSPGFITEALPDRADLDPAPARPPAHRGVRRPVAAATRPSCCSSSWASARPRTTFDQRRWAHGATASGRRSRLLADALGLPLDSVEASGEVAVAAARPSRSPPAPSRPAPSPRSG